jgi:hypothetical protein
MPKPLQRVRLESGLKLDLNRLIRRGFIRPGVITGAVGIAWADKCTGDAIASGLIIADLSSIEGWFRIQLGSLDHHKVRGPMSAFGGKADIEISECHVCF